MRKAHLALLLAAAAQASEPDLALLKARGISADAASLGGYLRALAPTEAERARALLDVADLGSPDPVTRNEAIARLGMMKAPPLAALRGTLSSNDPEVRRVGARLLEAALHRVRKEMLLAVLRIVADEGTKGLAGEVLGIAPLAVEMRIEHVAAAALRATLRAEDLELLRAAAAKAEIDTRCVALRALGAAPGAGPDEALPALEGGDARLRLAAARALADRGDRRCLVPLLALLEAESVDVRRGAAETLRAVLGGVDGFDALGAPEGRRAAIEAWRKRAEAAPDTWEHPLPLRPKLLGRTLVALFAEGRVVDLDAEGKRVFEVSGLERPWAVQGLPNGHRLVLLLNQATILEYDAEGAERGRLKLAGQPGSFERLDNGNTLVTIPSQGTVAELKPDGETASELYVQGLPTFARALDNGRLLLCLLRPPQVVEVERTGEVRWSLDGLKHPVSAQRLDNGNTLVADLAHRGRVAEYDPEGRVVWELNDLQYCYSAQRLPDGSTLIADRTGVRVIAADGTERWLQKSAAFARAHRY